MPSGEGQRGTAGPPPASRLRASQPPGLPASRPPRLRPRSPLPVPAKMASPAAARALLRDLALRPRLLAARSQVSGGAGGALAGAAAGSPPPVPGARRAVLRPGRTRDPHLHAARAGAAGDGSPGPSLGAARLAHGAGGPRAAAEAPAPGRASAACKLGKSSSPGSEPAARCAFQFSPCSAPAPERGGRPRGNPPAHPAPPGSAQAARYCRLGAPSWRETQ